ncbi:MAG: bifunctional phosphoribosyl-AMP cyclohydrolase/phosphoribosyl-ATP diphosphatase HisIE [Lachnospiraceae bacterium]|nr:bifunctional phosphoribosyl-AMP cyclohydrolase/phosphoribosyl-ATP diphosphatase HisIE [Lachnospiraceae bacterium]
MNQKQLLATIFLFEGKPVKGLGNHEPIADYEDAAELAAYYNHCGADGMILLDLESDTDQAHEKNIDSMKEVIRVCDIPVYAGGTFHRFEDAKKYLYTGAAQAILYYTQDTSAEELEEAQARFGKEKLMLCTDSLDQLLTADRELLERITDQVLVLNYQSSSSEQLVLSNHQKILTLHTDQTKELLNALKQDSVIGITGAWAQFTNPDLMAFKSACQSDGISMEMLESRISWNELKLNSEGMIPVIVQDYKTNEVLMLAYMNDEAFHETLSSGKMTYWSRSRNELWKKGMTSGHFQSVKSLTADCDKDTILAKVFQVGAACHTGSRSCFFNEMVKKDYTDTNPLKVFEDVYAVILDRKEHPKKGSYTNYLFDKGIDKILKKVGEEATEIVIAAKNPNPEEIKYEISDFLYHVMVLMAERGVTWEDITRELAQR